MIISFEEYNKKEDELKNYKRSICELINKFIDYDDDFLKNHHIREPFKGVYDFYIDQNNFFKIFYSYGEYRSTDAIFSDDEYLRLKKFMKNPDIFINSKKYNL